MEIPIAQLTSLTANINRDSKKRPQPWAFNDFVLYAEERADKSALRAEVAAVALELRHADLAPRLLIACWDKVIAAATESAAVPVPRALCNADGSVWVLAPQFEGRNIRAGLVLVDGRVHGPCTLRDLDRQLLTYRIALPEHRGFGWIDANTLLLAAE